jgi:hypothetical protein
LALNEDEKKNCLEIIRPQSFATIYGGMEDSDMVFDLVLDVWQNCPIKIAKILQVHIQ